MDNMKIVDNDGKLLVAEVLTDGDRYVWLDQGGSWGIKIAADGTFRAVGRRDNRFWEVVMTDATGNACPVIREEPQKAIGDNVGNVGVVYRPDGMVLTVDCLCQSGDTTPSLIASSVSKGGAVPGKPVKDAVYFNPKRIIGRAGVLLTCVPNDTECLPKQRWMAIPEFIKDSRDGRSLVALAAACLDPDFAKVYAAAMLG